MFCFGVSVSSLKCPLKVPVGTWSGCMTKPPKCTTSWRNVKPGSCLQARNGKGERKRRGVQAGGLQCHQHHPLGWVVSFWEVGTGRRPIWGSACSHSFESSSLEPIGDVSGCNFRRKAKCWLGIEFEGRDFSHSSLELVTVDEGWGILVKVRGYKLSLFLQFHENVVFNWDLIYLLIKLCLSSPSLWQGTCFTVFSSQSF